MTKKPRFYGWEFGDNARDQVVYGVYQRFREQGGDFADYCKELVYQEEVGKLKQSDSYIAVLNKLDEIKRMLQSGSLVYQGNDDSPGTNDQELLNLLGNVST